MMLFVDSEEIVDGLTGYLHRPHFLQDKVV